MGSVIHLCIDGGRSFIYEGLSFTYEELSGLELLGMNESEPFLSRIVERAMSGAPAGVGTIRLDLRWRDGSRPNQGAGPLHGVSTGSSTARSGARSSVNAPERRCAKSARHRRSVALQFSEQTRGPSRTPHDIGGHIFSEPRGGTRARCHGSARAP